MNMPADKFVPVATLKAQMEAIQAQIAESEAVEKASAKIIAEIKKANIAPAVLTALLQQEGLILGATPKDEAKTIFQTEVSTQTGRKSTFKIWEGRPVDKLTGDALKYWNSVKSMGKDEFVAKATADGKAYFATEKGKTWLATAFK
jgi:hypothetical protein